MNKNLFTVMFITISIASCLSVRGAQAKTYYKWIDQAGRVHITDHQPASGEALSVKEVEAKERGQGKPHGLLESLGAEVGGVAGPSALERLQEIIPHALSVGDTNALTLFAQLLFLFLSDLLCLYLIYRRTSTPYAWLSWIPIAHIFPFVGAAGYSWYVGLVFTIVPALAVALAFYIHSIVFVLIIIAVAIMACLIFILVCWMRICTNLNSSRWLALLLYVPYLQFLVLPYLAFKEQPIIKGVNRLRPTVITLVVWAGCVVTFAMLSPHIADSQLFQTKMDAIKIDATRWFQNIGLHEGKSAL